MRRAASGQKDHVGRPGTDLRRPACGLQWRAVWLPVVVAECGRVKGWAGPEMMATGVHLMLLPLLSLPLMLPLPLLLLLLGMVAGCLAVRGTAGGWGS